MKVINVGNVTIKDGLSEIIEKLKLNPEKVYPVIASHALNIQANAANPANGIPIDTGYLASTIKAEKIDDGHWTVHDGTDYGVYQELGTSRGISAKHFLGGAAEREAKPFFEDVKKALSE